MKLFSLVYFHIIDYFNTKLIFFLFTEVITHRHKNDIRAYRLSRYKLKISCNRCLLLLFVGRNRYLPLFYNCACLNPPPKTEIESSKTVLLIAEKCRI